MLEKPSCCKVNLLLNILGPRPDGFHELETVMHPVNLCDFLSFNRDCPGIQLTCNDSTLPLDRGNLVFRAAELFLKTSGINEGVQIHLEKKIPVAAGLGGGSGNAATALLGLNELFGRPLAENQMTTLAATLGSDVPFFLQSQPALATGRGEIIQPLAFFPSLEATYILLVHPGFGISTPWAYQRLTNFPAARNGEPGRAARLIATLREESRAKASQEFYNSLEAPALPKYPLLRLFQQFFRENGAWATLMSGSGSTTFALVETKPCAEQLMERFKAKFGAEFWTATVKMN
jgi:4-diphosphocytidyl-2-C-methyl-D-erythritol kinase